MRFRTKITLWRHDRVPGTRSFCHKMSLEQNSLACPIIDEVHWNNYKCVSMHRYQTFFTYVSWTYVQTTLPLEIIDRKNFTTVLWSFEMLRHEFIVIIPWFRIALVDASVAPSREWHCFKKVFCPSEGTLILVYIRYIYIYIYIRVSATKMRHDGPHKVARGQQWLQWD